MSLREPIWLGQRIDRWRLSAETAAGTVVLASGESIGARRLWRGTNEVAATALRLEVSGPVSPAISEVGVYRDPLHVASGGVPMSAPPVGEPLAAWGLPADAVPLIAGPCSAESRDQVLATAAALAPLPVHIFRAGVWKPRTRPGTFEGVGEPALEWLAEASRMLGRPAAVEVGSPDHLEAALRAGIGVVWIGARTTANPFMVAELAEALRGVGVPVLVKNPVNPDLQLWVGALERLAAAGVRRLAAIHRGFSTDHPERFRNAPLWRIPLELRRLAPSIPLWCDPSHIAGDAALVGEVAQTALDLLYDGLMIECHADPPSALSDARQQLRPEQLRLLLGRLERRRPTADRDEVCARIEALRHDLDETDGRLVELLAARMAVVRQIARVQKAANVAVFQPDRWLATLERLRARGAERGLDPDFMADLYRLIHEEALRHKAAVTPKEEGQ